MIEEYLTGEFGILKFGQYLFLFILSFNPTIFSFFKRRHFYLLAIGTFFSVFNHRAILPFLLLVILDMDIKTITSETRKWILFWFGIAILFFFIFAGYAK